MSLRQERLKKEFFKIIKEFFLYQVNNPLLRDIIIQEVIISRDLSYLKIYYQTARKIDNIFEKALKNIIPVIKGDISKHLSLRKIPNITFVSDNRAEYTDKVNSILSKITYSKQTNEEILESYKNLDIEDL